MNINAHHIFCNWIDKIQGKENQNIPIIYQICQLLGYNQFLPKLTSYKNDGIFYKHDSIWKKICEFMGVEDKGWALLLKLNQKIIHF